MTCLCRLRGEAQVSSNPFPTWHQKVGGQYQASTALTLGKIQYLLYRRPGGPQV